MELGEIYCTSENFGKRLPAKNIRNASLPPSLQLSLVGHSLRSPGIPFWSHCNSLLSPWHCLQTFVQRRGFEGLSGILRWKTASLPWGRGGLFQVSQGLQGATESNSS